MSQLPYLLPWVRVALLIRSILSTPFDETAWPTRQDGIGPSPRHAEPARTGGLVELAPGGRRLWTALGLFSSSRRSPDEPTLHLVLGHVYDSTGLRLICRLE